MLKRRIKEKMQSEQGTSIFFGLLLFLTASILSVVILEGAVTTVKTVASDRTSEQNQLACTSAAQLLRDSIVNVKLSADIVETKTGDHVKTTKNWNLQYRIPRILHVWLYGCKNSGFKCYGL